MKLCHVSVKVIISLLKKSFIFLMQKDALFIQVSCEGCGVGKQEGKERLMGDSQLPVIA